MASVLRVETKSERTEVGGIVWAGIAACGLWAVIFLHAALRSAGADPWQNIKDMSVLMSVLDSVLYLNSLVCSAIWTTRNLSILLLLIVTVTWVFTGIKWSRVLTLKAIVCVLLFMLATTLGMGVVCTLKEWIIPSHALIQVMSGRGTVLACISLSLSSLAYSLQREDPTKDQLWVQK